MLWPSVRRPECLRRKLQTWSSAGLNAVAMSLIATLRRTAARIRGESVSTFTSYVMIFLTFLRWRWCPAKHIRNGQSGEARKPGPVDQGTKFKHSEYRI